MYQPVSMQIHPGSRDLAPHNRLDPEIFDGLHMNPSVRRELLSMLHGFMSQRYQGHERWLRAWLAGSGASYRWYADPINSDLDILLGVEPIDFRRSNPQLNGLGNREIADQINEDLRAELWPATNNWKGHYEVTWYVNPRSWDIRTIKPYAAYDLVNDRWEVSPSKEPVSPASDDWEQKATGVGETAQRIITGYNHALNTYQTATAPNRKVDAEAVVRSMAISAMRMYDLIHSSRKLAFSGTGDGFDDFNNFMWQRGKQAGWIPALRQIKEMHTGHESALYGSDGNDLIRRAVSQYR